MNIFLYNVLLYIGFSLNWLPPQAQTNLSNTSPQIRGGKQLSIPLCRFEPGNLKHEAVSAAHAKDLAVHDKYGVLINNYRVKEDNDLVFCPNSTAPAGAMRMGSSIAFPRQRTQLLSYKQKAASPATILNTKQGDGQTLCLNLKTIRKEFNMQRSWFSVCGYSINKQINTETRINSFTLLSTYIDHY
ncbi:MAG TPA: hypothetical protein VFO70_05555 [Chitinophagaceae bacterium]|nr:hypothetical protein [Chitinophagaceae bacterium]